jgi:transposase
MEILYSCCCGLDVHAKTVAACLIKHGKKQLRTFSTMTDDLLRLSDWLVTEGCTHVAIESTGVYWKPVFNILEGNVEVILVNAHHIKAVPGRKTDVRDCEWLADLLRHGLVRASFIPPLPIRELRELTRYRQTLVKEQVSVANRIQKLAESGNIKLGQVASVGGEDDTQKVADLARGRLKRKKADLKRALDGRLTKVQRWVIGELLDRYEELERAVSRVNEQIHQQVQASGDASVAQAEQLLKTIPGVADQIAQIVISEIGVDMSRFASHRHLSSWAAMCPGNNESAGKRKREKTNKGSRYLRTALVQAAWAASHTKETYLSAQYQRLVKRMGKKKALVAVGHSILVIIYYVLLRQVRYEEMGGDYFERRNVEKQSARLVRKLESLGLRVTAEPLEQAG